MEIIPVTLIPAVTDPAMIHAIQIYHRALQCLFVTLTAVPSGVRIISALLKGHASTMSAIVESLTNGNGDTETKTVRIKIISYFQDSLKY